jgi:hypothetical protein
MNNAVMGMRGSIGIPVEDDVHQYGSQTQKAELWSRDLSKSAWFGPLSLVIYSTIYKLGTNRLNRSIERLGSPRHLIQNSLEQNVSTIRTDNRGWECKTSKLTHLGC